MYGAHGWSIKSHGVTMNELSAQRDAQHAKAVARERESLAAYASLRKAPNLRGEAVRSCRSRAAALSAPPPQPLYLLTCCRLLRGTAVWMHEQFSCSGSRLRHSHAPCASSPARRSVSASGSRSPRRRSR